MKTALLREIEVHVARVNPGVKHSVSPEYVFAVRPISRSQLGSTTTRRQDLDPIANLERDNAPVVHEVAHTYSECRALYHQLQHLTDCKNMKACCCALGSCPFWSLFAVLGSIEFPKRTLFNHQSKHVFKQRTRALDALMRTILAVLRANYRLRHFRCYEAPFEAAHVCKVLVAICTFFELDSPEVEQRLLDGSERFACKMNLQGWQSDRPNLYFRSEDKKKYRDAGDMRQRKSMEIELRPSLNLLDDDYKDPTSSDEDEERRSSLLLIWS
ncbi:hypothetical protein PHYBOEH_009622 [Phytophthora boehmeriae]|uniref:Uncharacterized protein n=1 Tax=Phytophthora boehmeriae TaxID=109152 RepID=A0A8T1WYN1_9STRA|nr:hypothetical protein PHYBOEH_009622 [Phytophthora boehmeriae]